MTSRHTFARYALCTAMMVVLAGPAAASDRKTTNTLLGAGLGAAAGAVLSEGDPMLILGGAAAGGLLGNVLTENRKYDSHSHSHSHRRHYKTPKHRYGSRHAPYYASSHYSDHHRKHKKYKKHRKYKKHYR